MDCFHLPQDRIQWYVSFGKSKLNLRVLQEAGNIIRGSVTVRFSEMLCSMEFYIKMASL
jgi:hypothetical protein